MRDFTEKIYPSDIRNMTDEELAELASDIRSYMIESLSGSGGHLASNLGIVELTLAIHKVFDMPKDKVVWDVGHQSYVHKILTGRGPELPGIRSLGGMSGFPKRCESEYDFFDSGHSSNSISAALGMAVARDMNREDGRVVAVIGDGALTGGMAYEALNNAGAMTTDLIVILNDNEMSIAENSGGVAIHLESLRASKGYMSFKEKLRRRLGKSPRVVRRKIYRVLRSFRNTLKYAILTEGVLFEELGFKYLGPVDGHDISETVNMLELAKNMKRPVLVHAITKKGKGYGPAEERPDVFHGTGPFDTETGEPLTASTSPSWSEVFGEELALIGSEDSRVTAVSAAMISGTGLTRFSKEFPCRTFDVGIAESHAVTFGCGMALSGLKPVVAIYSTFLQRAYDQVLIDVCQQKANVIFAVDRAGAVGADGETHHGIYDLSYLLPMPGLTVMAPSTGKDLRNMLRYALTVDGPSAIRYPRGSAFELPEEKAGPVQALPGASGTPETAGSTDPAQTLPGALGTPESAGSTGPAQIFSGALETPESAGSTDPASALPGAFVYRKGKDVTIVSVGRMLENVLKAAGMLEKEGIGPEIIDPRVLKPLDIEIILGSVRKTGALVTVEDNAVTGGFGSYLRRELSACAPDLSFPVINIGWPDEFIKHGKVGDLEKIWGLDHESIYKKVCEIIERKA